MWIDLNHDGKFTYSTNPADNELIVNNNVYQGPTHRTNNTADVIAGHSGHPNLVLAAGVYDVAFGMYEGGGGSEAQYFMMGPATGGAEVSIAGNIPGVPGSGTLQEGLWTATDGTLTDANFSLSTVTVTADSTLDIFAPSASFGALTVPSGMKLAAGEPTPGMGLLERLAYYSMLVWIATVVPLGATPPAAEAVTVPAVRLKPVSVTVVVAFPDEPDLDSLEQEERSGARVEIPAPRVANGPVTARRRSRRRCRTWPWPANRSCGW